MLFGRLANFVNGELWGRVVTDPYLPWAMIFPDAPDQLPRHPSQLYEAGREGLMMIVVMLFLFWKTRARYCPGLLIGVFSVVIVYARLIVEFFSAPDAHLAAFARQTARSPGTWITLLLFTIYV